MAARAGRQRQGRAALKRGCVMGALLYLSLLLAMFLLTRAAAPGAKTDCHALYPRDVPDSVMRTARLALPGIGIRKIRVFMDGPDAVHYLVYGTMPDGQPVRLLVQADASAHLLDERDRPRELPLALNRRLSQCLPSFHPARNSVRLVHGGQSTWYEMEGKVAGVQEVSLKISLDGHDMLMTVNDNRP
jgi:hypothetical protein